MVSYRARVYTVPKSLKLPHLRTGNVNVPWERPAAAPERAVAVEEDWSGVYAPTEEERAFTASPREIATLASLWGSEPAAEVQLATGPDLEAIWRSEIATETGTSTVVEEDFGLSSDVVYGEPRTASVRRTYPDSTSIRAVREAARSATGMAREARRAFAEASRPIVLREARPVSTPPAPTSPKKTPMQRAAEITSQPTAYDRLLKDD